MLDLLNKISSTTKRTEKEQILSSLDEQEATLFKRLAYLTYDPSVDYYLKEFNTKTEHLDCVTLTSALYDLEQIIASRVFTGNMARQWVEQQYEMLSKDDAEVFKRVIKRDLRIGMNSKSINKVFPCTIYEHPYMRCSGFSEKSLKNIQFPCVSQTKMDGLYCDIIVRDDEYSYRSRNGSFLSLDGDWNERLIEHATGYVLMGEVLAVDEEGIIMDRASSNGYLNGNDVEQSRVRFFIWDCVPVDMFDGELCKIPYIERFHTAIDIVKKIGHPFAVVDAVMCNDQRDIIDHFRKNRLDGQEGTIIKDQNGVWKPGTSKTQIKCKVVFECEMRLIGYKEGTGKNEGRLGALEFESDEGNIQVSVGTGYKDKDRDSWWSQLDQWIKDGKVGTIRANDVTYPEDQSKMSLFLPRFVEWRTDKDTPDTQSKIIEQVTSFTDALKMIGES
jgi:DNA ligase-1